MQASFGKIILTPPEILGGYLGRTMAGYTPVATIKGKHDDIHGYCALIQETMLGNIKKNLLLISMDYCQIPLIFSEYIKEKIQEKYQINPNQIIIHTTHTHKSIDLVGLFTFGGNLPGVIKGIILGGYNKWFDKYKIWVAKQMVKLVGNLLETLQPAEIAWKQKIFDEWVATNRRSHLRSDQPMGIIVCRNPETKHIFGTIINFGAHPTTLSGRDSNLSADYPGRVTHKFNELLFQEQEHNGFQSIFFTGPAGDIAPAYMFMKDFLKLRKQARKNHSFYPFTTAYGYKLADLAYKLMLEIKEEDYMDKLVFKSYVKRFWVPMEDYKLRHAGWLVKLNNALTHFLKRRLVVPLALVMGDVNEPNFPGIALKHKNHKINIYSEIQFITINGSKGTKNKSMSILGVPGELFEEYAKKMRSKSPAETNFIFQASNDWIAYLFPLKQYIEKGGYEPYASFGPLCGAYVYNNFKKLIEELNLDITAGYY